MPDDPATGPAPVGAADRSASDRSASDRARDDGAADGGDKDDGDRMAANRAMWDERVPIHVAGDFYDVEGFRSGRRPLAVRGFEVEELGDVDGRTLVHLQCHFGLDTLSWARLGARVTGLDFSGPAVAAATGLAAELGLEAEFVEADVYDAGAALGGRQFDIVYTGKGALIWLPDIERWAAVCAALLAPGGTFYLSEFHPVSDMFAWETLTPETSYFARTPVFDDSPGTYADLDAVTTHNASYVWMHPLGTVVSALIDAGLVIEFLHEQPITLFPRWPFLERTDDGAYVMPSGMPEMPLMYSLRASRPGA